MWTWLAAGIGSIGVIGCLRIWERRGSGSVLRRRIQLLRRGFLSRGIHILKRRHTPANKPEAAAASAPEYLLYRLRIYERVGLILAGGTLGFCVGWLFYDQVLVAILFSASGLLAPRRMVRRRVKARMDALESQFRQALYALSSSLSAGRSIENAFSAAIPDLQLLYGGSTAYILQEFERLDRRVLNGEPVEQALQDFSLRSGSEAIRQFHEVFVTCKRSGGNLVEVMRRTSQLLGDKLELQQELAVLMAQKRLESRVMMAAPLVVVAMLRLGSPDYMAPLYETPAGAVLMTICLAAFLGCWRWTNGMMKLEVAA